MLNRKIEIKSQIESGEIGEIRDKDGHTYINRRKLSIHNFYIFQEIEDMPGILAREIHMDEQELETFLVFNIRARKSFYRALDQLNTAERNEILMGYVNGEKK